ncbi:SLOG family protein [Streptomyces rochei]|uniref:SLOG family protein n=1 Tax=Streptomyces TaxID=1883 RepID=UPI001E525A6A|nr:SLOG family protein [Streptomyces sp. DH1]
MQLHMCLPQRRASAIRSSRRAVSLSLLTVWRAPAGGEGALVSVPSATLSAKGEVRIVLELAEGRVLVCGSRRWPWPTAVEAVLDRLTDRYGDRLVVIEGSARGADFAACSWCRRRGLGTDRHRCHPVDWAAAKRERPRDWRMAGPERNTRMLLQELPELVIAFHDHFVPASGGTSDMCLRAVLRDVPVWLVPGPDVQVGAWLGAAIFPDERARRVQGELEAFLRGPDR